MILNKIIIMEKKEAKKLKIKSLKNRKGKSHKKR